MKKKIYLMLAFMLVIGTFGGCSRWETLEPGEPFIYYLTMSGTGIEKRAYDWVGETAKEEIQTILDALGRPDESDELKAAIPEDVVVQSFELQNEKLDIYFSKEYRKLDDVQEVLCRAAVVQSLVQVKEVRLVKIFVENEPIVDKEGKVIGYMSGDEFVQNTGESLSSFQKVELTLWLPNKKGDALIKDSREIRYSSSVSIEKVVIEQLMKKKVMSNELVIIPPETKLLGVTVKDGICYVNFDEGFQISGYTINPELSIFAIVNSIVENSTASQVQISIEGKTDVKFQNVVDLSKPLTMETDLSEVK